MIAHLISRGHSWRKLGAVIKKTLLCGALWACMGAAKQEKPLTPPNSSLQRRLFDAALKGDDRQIQALIQQGAQVNAFSLHGNVLYAAVFSDNLSTLQLLLAKGANPNVADFPDYPLNLAISQRNKEIGEAWDAMLPSERAPHLRRASTYLQIALSLLSHGASPNTLEMGTTPLLSAAFYNDIPMLRALLAHKPALEVSRGKMGSMTALVMAILCPRTFRIINGEKKHLEAITLLLNAGADVNGALDDGSTALMVASQACDVGAMKLLLARGANMALRDKKAGRRWDMQSGSAPMDISSSRRKLCRKDWNMRKR